MNTNEKLIHTFYEAFKVKDFKTMGECYHPEATFKDEAFDLKGKEVPAMWRMLCGVGASTVVEFSGVEADENTGKAHWEAWYTFSQSGNKVHNVIDATFTFKDGKILTHRDKFSFYRWSSQSLGMIGKLLGWTPFLKKQVRERAMGNLKKFIAKHPEYQ